MDALPIHIFDLGLIIVLVLGGLIGLALGFVKAGLFVLSWLGAIAATIYGFSIAQPYFHRYIESDLIADLAAAIAIFLVTLIVLFLVSSFIGSWVSNSRLNALDRSLGMLAGLATATLIVVGGVFLIDSATEEQPAWMRDARSLPILQTMGQSLNRIVKEQIGLPEDQGSPPANGHSGAVLDPARTVEKLIQPSPRETREQEGDGYDKKPRREMDRLIQTIPGRSDP